MEIKKDFCLHKIIEVIEMIIDRILRFLVATSFGIGVLLLLFTNPTVITQEVLTTYGMIVNILLMLFSAITLAGFLTCEHSLKRVLILTKRNLYFSFSFGALLTFGIIAQFGFFENGIGWIIKFRLFIILMLVSSILRIIKLIDKFVKCVKKRKDVKPELIYDKEEYECEFCGSELEEVQEFEDTALRSGRYEIHDNKVIRECDCPENLKNRQSEDKGGSEMCENQGELIDIIDYQIQRIRETGCKVINVYNVEETWHLEECLKREGISYEFWSLKI